MDLLSMIAAHRAHLLGAFRGPEWEGVALDYGAAGSSRRDQLRSALEAVVTWAREFESGPEIEGPLARFVEDAVAEASDTGARAGLSTLFANATASTGWWAERSGGDPVRVARCPGCGASQQRVLCFVCQSCGRALYGEVG